MLTTGQSTFIQTILRTSAASYAVSLSAATHFKLRNGQWL